MESCPCCGFETLPAKAGHDICALCGWQDDGQDGTAAAQVMGGPNAQFSLDDARRNFLLVGYFDPSLRSQARIKDSTTLKRGRYFEISRPSGQVQERSLEEFHNPLTRFNTWYQEALSAPGLDADAVALASVDEHKQPSVRIVYFRQLIDGKFCFYTNHHSQKGRELHANIKGALVFLWHDLGRQLRIEGTVKKIDDEQADAYFARRPMESQYSAMTSKQSEEMTCYLKFLNEIEGNKAKGPAVRPAHWAGFALDPQRIEFWHGREFRRHLREEYTCTGPRWQMRLLYP